MKCLKLVIVILLSSTFVCGSSQVIDITKSFLSSNSSSLMIKNAFTLSLKQTDLGGNLNLELKFPSTAENVIQILRCEYQTAKTRTDLLCGPIKSGVKDKETDYGVAFKKEFLQYDFQPEKCTQTVMNKTTRFVPNQTFLMQFKARKAKCSKETLLTVNITGIVTYPILRINNSCGWNMQHWILKSNSICVDNFTENYIKELLELIGAQYQDEKEKDVKTSFLTQGIIVVLILAAIIGLTIILVICCWKKRVLCFKKNKRNISATTLSKTNLKNLTHEELHELDQNVHEKMKNNPDCLDCRHQDEQEPFLEDKLNQANRNMSATAFNNRTKKELINKNVQDMNHIELHELDNDLHELDQNVHKELLKKDTNCRDCKHKEKNHDKTKAEASKPYYSSP